MLRIILIAMFFSFGACASSGPKTAVCKVDGQKFGTNLLCGDKIYHLDEDSVAGQSIYDRCATGENCKITFEANKKDEIIRVVSAAPAAANSKKEFLTSYNCNKAVSFVEGTICQHEDLAKLDVELATVFNMTLGKSNQKAALKAEQKKWIKEKRNSCHDVDCIRSAYKVRIDELKKL